MNPTPDPGPWPKIPSYIPDWMLDTASFALHASVAEAREAPRSGDDVRDAGHGATSRTGAHRAVDPNWSRLVGRGARVARTAGPVAAAGALVLSLSGIVVAMDRLWIGCVAGVLIGPPVDRALDRLAGRRAQGRGPRRAA